VESVNPFQAAPNSKKMLTLVGLYLGLVSQLIASTTFSGILRVAQNDFTDGSLWILAASIGGILGLMAMPLYGYFGARNPAMKRTLVCVSLLIGFIVLLARALAPNMMVIVVASTFWGFVSAGIFVLGFTMIREMFAQDKVGLYLGLIGTMISIGMLAGPVVGGIIMQSPLGWRGLNVILSVMMACAMLLLFFGVKAKKEDVTGMAMTSGNFDTVGTIGLMMFLGGLILVLSMTTFFPFGSMISNILIVVAVVGLVVLIADIIKKGDTAIIPKKIFGDMTSVILALVMLIANFSSLGLMYFLPQFIPTLAATDSLVDLFDPSRTGLALLLPQACMAVAGLFLGPIFGRAIAKSGNAKGVIIIGTVFQMIVIGGFFLMFIGILGKDASGIPFVPYWIILVLMLLAGVFSSRTSIVGSTAPQIQVKPEIRVQANSIVQVGQNLGAGVAIPIFGAIQAAFAIPLIQGGVDAGAAGIMALPDAMPVIMIVSFIPQVVLLLIAFLLKPLPKPKEEKAEE
jgi:MFS family permease